MAEQENFTPEQAQKLLEEMYETKAPTNAVLVTVAPTSANGETVVQAPAPTPVVEGATPPVVEKPPAVKPTDAPPVTPPATGTPPVEPVVKAPPAALAVTDPYAWVENLDPKIKENVLAEIRLRMNAEHAFRSNNGRIRALQEKLRESESKVVVRPQPAATAVPTSPTTPAEWEELKKTDPDLAKALEARVKSEVDAVTARVDEKLQELHKTGVEPLQDHARRQYVQHERETLQRLIPNVDQIVQSPHYSHWLENVAPPSIRDTALKSVDHRDAYAVMQHYAGWLVSTGQAEAPGKPAQTVAPTTQPPAVTPPATPPEKTAEQLEADRIAAEREARLKTPSTVPPAAFTPTGPGNRNGPVTREQQEQIFAEEWAKLHPKKT